MSKQPEIFLQHMIMAIDEIAFYIKGYSYATFIKDNKTISAVIRQLEIIGEAAGKIPEATHADSPIPFKNITGMRHKLIHDYFGVDVDVVWKTITTQLTPLKKYLLKKIG